MSLLHTTQDVVRSIARTLENPNEDFIAVMLTDTGLTCPILWGTEAAKQYAYHVAVPHVLKQTGAREVVFVMTAYMASAPAGTPREDLPRASKAPNRQEIVMLNYITKTEQTISYAEIKRFKNASPMVMEFKQMEPESIEMFLLSDAIKVIQQA